MSDSAAPGWYHAEGDPPNTERFWDGFAWTEGPRPIGGSAGVAPPDDAPTLISPDGTPPTGTPPAGTPPTDMPITGSGAGPPGSTRAFRVSMTRRQQARTQRVRPISPEPLPAGSPPVSHLRVHRLASRRQESRPCRPADSLQRPAAVFRRTTSNRARPRRRCCFRSPGSSVVDYQPGSASPWPTPRTRASKKAVETPRTKGWPSRRWSLAE